MVRPIHIHNGNGLHVNETLNDHTPTPFVFNLRLFLKGAMLINEYGHPSCLRGERLIVHLAHPLSLQSIMLSQSGVSPEEELYQPHAALDNSECVCA